MEGGCDIQKTALNCQMNRKLHRSFNISIMGKSIFSVKCHMKEPEHSLNF